MKVSAALAMFKKFNKNDQSGSSQVKSSVARGIRANLITQFPVLEQAIDDIMPKKQPVVQTKCAGHINILSIDGNVLFAQHRDGPFIPHLSLVHKYPNMLPRLQVDRGAIKFVINGSNIMCPGLTSPGATMDNVEAETVCGIYAEDKEHALAIGVTTMATTEIRDVNKGIGVETLHFLGDGLWLAPTLD